MPLRVGPEPQAEIVSLAGAKATNPDVDSAALLPVLDESESLYENVQEQD